MPSGVEHNPIEGINKALVHAVISAVMPSGVEHSGGRGLPAILLTQEGLAGGRPKPAKGRLA